MIQRYQLAPYVRRQSKIDCPRCGSKGTFRRYLDTKTGQYTDPEFGWCDRQNTCDYNNYPKNSHETISPDELHKSVKIKDLDKYNVIPKTIFDRSFENQLKDNLSDFLIKKFSEADVANVLRQYCIGAGYKWKKRVTVFWQIDINGQVRSGKIMAYKKQGNDIKRVKSGDFPLIDWVHSAFKGDFNLKQVFFGEHLLKSHPDYVVNIVESEKTAIICAIVYPQCLWLATGSINGINDEKMKVLKDRKIRLFPDKGQKAVKTWQKKADVYKKQGYDIELNDCLEKKDNLKEGDDIADYILKMANE